MASALRYIQYKEEILNKMKFKDTYSLLNFLMENDNIGFSIHENNGFPFLKIIGNLDEALEKHLEERITN